MMMMIATGALQGKKPALRIHVPDSFITTACEGGGFHYQVHLRTGRAQGVNSFTLSHTGRVGQDLPRQCQLYRLQPPLPCMKTLRPESLSTHHSISGRVIICNL